jgi:Flp pilus assembly protein CpaB
MNRSRLLHESSLRSGVRQLRGLQSCRATTANNEPGADVIVAANDLQVGSKLQDGDIRRSSSASVIPPNSYKLKSWSRTRRHSSH